MGSGQSSVCVWVCSKHTQSKDICLFTCRRTNEIHAKRKAVNANPWKDGTLTPNRTHWAIRMNYWCMLIFMQVIMGKVLIFLPNLQRKVLPSLFRAQWLHFNQKQTAFGMYRINSGRFPGSALWWDVFSVLAHRLTFLLSDKGYCVVGYPILPFGYLKSRHLLSCLNSTSHTESKVKYMVFFTSIQERNVLSVGRVLKI